MLEKLGLKCPVDNIHGSDELRKFCSFLGITNVEVNKLLTKRKQWEMLLERMIINVVKADEDGYTYWMLEGDADEDFYTDYFYPTYGEDIKIIEQCTGMSWDEIKERIGK